MADTVNLARIGLDSKLVVFVTGSPQPPAAIDSEVADSIGWKITGAQQHGVDGVPRNPSWSDVMVMLDDGTDDCVTGTRDDIRNARPGGVRSVFIVSGASWGDLTDGVREVFAELTTAPTDEVSMVLVLADGRGLPSFDGAARQPVVEQL